MGVRRTLLTTGLVVVAVVAGMWVHARAQTPKVTRSAKVGEAVIVLEMGANGCGKTLHATEGTALRANAGGPIRWRVININCAGLKEAITVSLKDFALKADPTKPKPPLSKENLSCYATPGSQCEIKTTVKKDAAGPAGQGKTTYYVYTVRIGDVQIDPDLIIDP